MDVPKNFSFYGVKKTLPVGIYKGKIVEFVFAERISKLNKPYVTLSAKTDIDGQFFFVNLSLDPTEKGKATHNLILQLTKQTEKTEEEIIELCQNPADFLEIAKDKVIDLVSTEKGYIDVMSVETVNPSDIPF